MNSEISSTTNGISLCHHLLLQRYFLLLQRLDKFPPLIWVPLFAPRWLRFLSIPILRLAVRLYVSGHIKRVLSALDRAYQLRLATDQPSPDPDNWKKLQEQTEAMDSALHPFVISKLALTILSVVGVFLIGFASPQKDSALNGKVIGAAITLNSEKLAELAAEPGALGAIVFSAYMTLMTLIALTPIVIWHFRFKRMLFNRPDLLNTSAFSDVTRKTIWEQKLTTTESLYVLERNLSMSLGEPVRQETPVDLLAILLAWGYTLAGPGLGVLVLALFVTNRDAQHILYYVGGFNASLSLFIIGMCLYEKYQRSRSLATV